MNKYIKLKVFNLQKAGASLAVGYDYKIEIVKDKIEIRNKLCLIFIMEILFVIFELLYFKFLIGNVELLLKSIYFTMSPSIKL